MFGLNKVPDLSSDGGDRKSGVTREPISIFSQIKNANDEEKKKGLTQLLETLKKNLPEGFKIGAAVSAGDCFFDSVAQGLNELKGKGPITSDEGFNVKSLRKDCANDARKYEDKIVKDANECGYFVPQKNIVFPHLENIKDKKGNDVPDVQETFDKYLDYIKNVATENGPIPIWGKLNIEGRMICDKYKVKIKVIELKEQPIGDTNVIESEEGEGTNVITMVNYKNHFVPLLSNIEKDIEESKEVPREEVYGNVVNSHRETSSLQNIGNSLPRKQSSMFHARGPDKENRPSEDVSPSKFISETLDKENYTEWLKQEDIARIADLQYGWHGENNNIIFDVLGSLEQLNSQLEQHQERLKNLNKQSLTYIINLGNCHWVTLVITYHNQRFLAYYIDSFGKSAEEGLLGQKNINISSLSINQQSDGYNCGIFALENARIINEGISSSETKNFKQKLGEMQLSKQQLEDMRRKFADLLQRNNTSLLDNDQLNDQIYTSCDEPDDESEKGKKRSALRNIMNLQEAIEQESLRNKENHAPNPINGGQRSGSISEIQRKSSRLKERTSTKSRNKESNVSAKSPLDQSSIELAQASQPVISLSKRKLGTEENDPTDKKRLRSNSFSLGDNNPAVYKSEREINILLEIFTEKFVEVFQEKLKDYSGRIIEKKEKQSSILSKLISLGFIGGGVKTASSVMSADLSRLSSATIGSITLLSSGVIDSLANKCIQAFQNQGAAKVARNTINFQVSKSQFREVLVRASVNVFKNYENQYLEMIFKGELGQKLGVEVLAYVAVQRAISYIKSQEDDIQAEVPEQYLEELYTLITKGVVLENSKVRNLKKKIEKNFHKAFLKFCSTVSSKKKDFHDLYDENMYNATGLVDVASDGAVNQYYTRQDGTSDTKKYGYRLAFEWELKNALDGWSPEENIRHTQYKYILKPEEIVHKVEQISRKVDEKSQVSKSDFQEMKDILMEIKGKLDSLHDAYPVQVSTNLVKNDVQGSGLLNEIEELKEDILKISDEKQKDDIRELETKLSVSVALHLAIAYIHQEKEKFKKRGGTKSWVSDYLKKLQEENLYGSKIQFKVNHDVKIVAAACNIILKKIKEREDLGIKALEIIEIMAYLDSDGVSIEEVFLQSASNKKEKLWSSIELLEKYSLIHLESGQSSIRKLV
ncbi:MAG: Ulp1 family isopeptidase, partial [Wolbachia pipientis]